MVVKVLRPLRCWIRMSVHTSPGSLLGFFVLIWRASGGSVGAVVSRSVTIRHAMGQTSMWGAV